jgi:plastocyanin
VGKVTVQKARKAKRPARYYLGPYRSARGTKSQEKSGPQDVVVYLEGAGVGKVSPSSVPAAVIRQKDETFIPHVVPVLAGTTVEFPNEDGFYHNVFSVMSGDRFDLGRYAKGETARQTFDRPGVVVVRCEIHAGMKAFIMVMKTSYFTVPDAEGTFSLPDLPAGTYTLKAWHPTQGEQVRPVSVPESGTVEIDISF